MRNRDIFMALRLVHILVDRSLVALFGLRFRQQYIRISYKIKTRLFPEYGSYIPADTAIGSPRENSIWMPPPIPQWVLSEMQELGRHIDPVLYPSDAFIASCQFYSFPVVPKPGQIYAQLIRQCSAGHYTHCFAIPWLKRGGADFVTLKHIEFSSKWPNAKVLVIFTELGESPWRGRIPENVDVIDLSKYINEISHEELLQVLVRLLVQVQIDVLHIINSRHAWEVVCKYGLAIRQRTLVFASIYCDDYDKYGQPVGFARQYLVQCHQHITKVFSDNAAFPKLLQQTYGFREELFVVLKSPVDISFKVTSNQRPRDRKVLWAGRLDRQKRPDLLLNIARGMPDVDFHVYGDSVLEFKNDIVGELKKLKNVIMNGGFDGAESLPFDNFPVFLYTSQWDGTPTIIIAAALASIPIVASCVGGVGDIINDGSGFAIHDIEDVPAYIRAIRYVFENPLDAQSRACSARQYVEEKHSQMTFESSLLKTVGYCQPLVFEEDMS